MSRFFLNDGPNEWAQQDSGPSPTTKKKEQLTPEQIKTGAEMNGALNKQLARIGLISTVTKDKKPVPAPLRWLITPEEGEVPYIEGNYRRLETKDIKPKRPIRQSAAAAQADFLKNRMKR